MKEAFDKLATEKSISARKYFMILRLAIYHIDFKYLETAVEIAQYEKSNKVWRQAIKILAALEEN